MDCSELNGCTSQALGSCSDGWSAVCCRWQKPGHRALFCGEVTFPTIRSACHASSCRYDPGIDQWSSVADMTCSRSGVGVAVLNSRLYAGAGLTMQTPFPVFLPMMKFTVGGFDGSSYLKSVELLDERNLQWRLAGSMSYRRLGCGVGVVWTSRHS